MEPWPVVLADEEDEMHSSSAPSKALSPKPATSAHAFSGPERRRFRGSPRPSLKVAASALVLLAVCSRPDTAAAQSTISRPGARFAYGFEAEPHVVFGPFGPPGSGRTSDGLGLGFRGTVELASQGFIAKINDSVGLGFGIDWLHHEYDNSFGDCTAWRGGPNGTRICVEVDGGRQRDVLVFPLVMQWNFWLTRQWSVFAEPGLFLFAAEGSGESFGIRPLALYVGGRYHFSDAVALTARLGYPSLSLGVSFFF